MLRKRVLASSFVLLAALLNAGAQAPSPAPPGPLSVDKVESLLKARLSSARLAALVREYHVAFQMTPDLEKKFRALGATDEVVKVLKSNYLSYVVPTATGAPPGPPQPPVLTMPAMTSSAVDPKQVTSLVKQENIKDQAAQPKPNAPAVPNSGQAAGAAVYDIGGDVTAPIALYQPDPPVPKKFKVIFQGRVTVEIIVDERGRVSDARVKKLFGYGCDGSDARVKNLLRYGCDEEAVRTVRTWLFKPGTKNGVPVKVRVGVVDVPLRCYR